MALHVSSDVTGELAYAFDQRTVPITPVCIELLRADIGASTRTDYEFDHKRLLLSDIT